MKVISPYPIADTSLYSSTVPENDFTEWNSGSTYAIGAKVIRSSVHKIYEALASSTGRAPESYIADWLDLGATNRWKMFDRKVGTRTTATGSIVVEFEMGKVVTSIALLEVDARSATVTVTDPVDGIVYSSTQTLQSSITIASWWSYFFEPFERKPSALFNGLPGYRNAVVTVEITGADEEAVECGVCIVGTEKVFTRSVQYGAKIGIQDFSRKETDDFGNVSVVQRPFAKRATFSFMIENKSVDSVQKSLADIRSTPAVYIGSGRFDSMVIYGFYTDFDIVVQYKNYSECSIEIEGLI